MNVLFRRGSISGGLSLHEDYTLFRTSISGGFSLHEESLSLELLFRTSISGGFECIV